MRKTFKKDCEKTGHNIGNVMLARERGEMRFRMSVTDYQGQCLFTLHFPVQVMAQIEVDLSTQGYKEEKKTE